jgi:hypothetical protein
MKVRRNFSSAIMMGLLITTLVASWPISQPLLTVVRGAFESEHIDIDVNVEYSNGSIGSPLQGLSLWYAWVNTSGTQIIYLAYQSHILNPPVVTFLGQHYYIENDTEIFVGNTLSAMEVYNDTNRNGVPDADFIMGTSEIVYYFVVNSSVSFVITPIEKSIIDNLPHYTWGIRYETIDGFLLFEDESPAARVMLSYMEFSYDFYIQNNVSYLKTNFSVGEPLEITSFPGNNVTLDGLSLALFYGTTIITSKPYTTLVNGEPYNSTTATALPEPTEIGEIRVEDTKVYEFVFGQNYTLFKDSQQESHKSQSTAVAKTSVSSGIRMSIEWLLSNLEEVLSDLFPRISSMQTAITLDYNVSSFLYRVCYPVWDGCSLKHDPTYVAYLSTSSTSVPPPPITELAPPLQFLIAAALLGLVALVIALADLRKTRKALKYSIPNPLTTL